MRLRNYGARHGGMTPQTNCVRPMLALTSISSPLSLRVVRPGGGRIRDRRIRSHQTSIVEGNHFARRFCVEYSAGMQRTLRTLMLLSIFCAAPVAFAENIPTAKPEAVGLSSARLERLATAIRAEVDRGKMPGAV